MKVNKKKTYALLLAVSVISVLCLSGCGSRNDDEQQAETGTVVKENPNIIPTTDRTKGWFDDGVEKYVQSVMSGADFKAYSSVYDTRNGISEDNALLYASADLSIYVKSGVLSREELADISDNFARKLAQDGAAGDIVCSIYSVPASIYDQIDGTNYSQAEEKAKEMDGYMKFGFRYSGIGDAIHMQEDQTSDMQEQQSADIPDFSAGIDDGDSKTPATEETETQESDVAGTDETVQNGGTETEDRDNATDELPGPVDRTDVRNGGDGNEQRETETETGNQ